MRDWNVVAITREHRFSDAVHLLRNFGEVEKTGYFDVVVIRVAEIHLFLDQLHERLGEEPVVEQILGRVSPCTATFVYHSPDEFETKARRAVRELVPKLAGRRFHVRMHRRGFKGRLHAMEEEQFLDKVLLEMLDEQATPGTISFEDPQAIVAIETVDTRAGLAAWTDTDLARYRLLSLD